MDVSASEREKLVQVIVDAARKERWEVVSSIAELLKQAPPSGDGPSAEVEDESGSTMTVDGQGNKEWNNAKGQPHRLDGPAVVYANGFEGWYANGKLHRTDGPAFEMTDGTKLWYANGVLHRTDGPAVEGTNGTKLWYVHGKRHRTDGPAIEGANGDKFWYVHDKRHRTDGPAVVRGDGTKEWWVDDKQLTEAEFKERFGAASKGGDDDSTEPDSTMTVDGFGNKE